jgi:hypothetical protein
MKGGLLTIGLMLVAASTCLAADTFESLTRDMIKAMNDTADILSGIKDSKTATNARPKLRAAKKKLADLKQRMDALGKPSKKVAEQLKTEYQEKIQAADKRLRSEALRVATVEGGKEALKELQP